MRRFGRGQLLPLLLAGLFLAANCRPAPAQFLFQTGRYELNDAVTLDKADSTAETHLERVRACLHDKQWDEAVETLRQVMANYGDKVIELPDHRYVSVRQYCHLRIAALPAPALELYRNRVDPQARSWYERGIAERSQELLHSVVEQFFCSRYGDDALFALGEIALEQGDYPAARSYWARLVAVPPWRISGEIFDRVRRAEGLPAEDAQMLDRWYRPTDTDRAPLYILRADERISDDAIAQLVRFWNAAGLLPELLFYPQTDRSLAEIRARLVLVSILEGSPVKAKAELEEYCFLHPGAEGKIAGKSGELNQLLADLLSASAAWPIHVQTRPWLTFAGSPERTNLLPHPISWGELLWQQTLPQQKVASTSIYGGYGSGRRRVADDNVNPLSYFPLVVGNTIYVGTETEIFAFDANTGKPATIARDDGTIFKHEENGVARHTPAYSGIGAPRYTLTVHAGKLYARLGSPITSIAQEAQPPQAPGYLICLDLAEQRLQWKIVPDDENWAFEGAPVCDGPNIYVAMRRSGNKVVWPQAHVACFDAQTGARLWRRLICSAEIPGRGSNEITHNLLTLHRDTVYTNTNLGVVAALSVRDGQTKWLVRYPRAQEMDWNRPSAHFFRDLNPAIVAQGKLLVAPSDAAEIMALDSQTGELLWKTSPGEPSDVVHLLGVGGGKLIASGDRVWWIDIESGKPTAIWPDGPQPKGFGRGLLAGDEVLWPTRGELYRFDLRTGARLQSTDLAAQGLEGGNLIAADGQLLIATSGKLLALKRHDPLLPAESKKSGPPE